MISIEQRRRDQMYQYRGGMLNAAWVAGVARRITPRGGFIQQSNNLNQMIGFVLEEGDSMPNSVREGSNLKVIGRIHSSREGAEPVVVLWAAWEFCAPPAARDSASTAAAAGASIVTLTFSVTFQCTIRQKSNQKSKSEISCFG